MIHKSTALVVTYLMPLIAGLAALWNCFWKIARRILRHRLHGNELSGCGVITNLYLQQVSYGQYLHSVMNNAASMLERRSLKHEQAKS